MFSLTCSSVKKIISLKVFEVYLSGGEYGSTRYATFYHPLLVAPMNGTIDKTVGVQGQTK